MRRKDKWFIMISAFFCVVMVSCSQKVANDQPNDDHNTNTVSRHNNNHTDRNNDGLNDDVQTKKDLENDDSNGIPKAADGKPLYYELNEPFVIETPTNSKIWMHVEEIWTESGAEHEAYIAEQMDDPRDDMNLTFVKLNIKNNGHKQASYFEVLPAFHGDYSGGKRIDISYPENDVFTEVDDTIDTYIQPAETVEVVGATVSHVDDSNGGVLTWRDMSRNPAVVFQTPQSERRDQFGVYDFGEKIYALDKSEAQQLNATVYDVEIAEEPSIEKRSTDSTFLVINMAIENTGTETQRIVNALPMAFMNDELLEQEMTFDNGKGLVDDPWGDSDIVPDEILEGTLYIELASDMAPHAQLYFMDKNLFIYPDYAMKLNYNLDEKEPESE